MENTAEKIRDHCEVCDGKKFSALAGLYFCDECGTQSKTRLHIEYEQNFNPNLLLTNKTTIKQPKKNQVELTTWEEYNYILFGLTNELIDLGAKDELRMTVLQLWTSYLRKTDVAFTSTREPKIPKLGPCYSNKDARLLYNIHLTKKRKRSRAGSSINSSIMTKKRARLLFRRKQSQLATAEYNEYAETQSTSIQNLSGSTSFIGSSSVPSSGSFKIEFSRTAKRRLKKVIPKKHLNKHESDATLSCHSFKRKYFNTKFMPEVMSRLTLYEILYIALNHIQDDIQLSDVIRYIREGHLPFHNVDKFFPENIIVKKPKNFTNNTEYPSQRFFRFGVARLVDLLMVQMKTPNILELCKRYVTELCLPSEISKMIETLLIICPPEMKCRSKKSSNFPSYEDRAIAYILFALKLLFGLDDDRETQISNSAIEINYCLDSIASDQPKLFVFNEWVKYIEMRNVILTQCHFSTAMSLDSQSNKASHLYIDYVKKSKIKADPENTDSKEKLHHQLSNLQSIFTKISDVQTESYNSYVPHFPLSLTPKQSYLSCLLKDSVASQNIYIPEFMYVDHAGRDLRSFFKPSELKELFKNHNIKINVKRIGCNSDNAECKNWYSVVFAEHENVSFYQYNDSEINEKEWSVNLIDDDILKEDAIGLEMKARKKEILNLLAKSKAENVEDNANKREEAMLAMQENDNMVYGQSEDMFAEDDKIKPRRHLKDAQIFDYLGSEDEQCEDEEQEQNQNETKFNSLEFILSNYDHWIYAGSPNIGDGQFDKIFHTMPKRFQWLVRQCASTTGSPVTDVYAELLIIENQFAYVLESFSKMTTMTLKQNLRKKYAKIGKNYAVLKGIISLLRKW